MKRCRSWLKTPSKKDPFFIYDFWRFCLVRKVDEVEKMKNTRSFESRKVRWGWRNSWRPVVWERWNHFCVIVS
jgi:hypothetical protein